MNFGFLIRTSLILESRLMNVEHEIRTCVIWSPGFSRIRRSRQYAVVPAGIQPAKAGAPGWHIRSIF